MDKPLWYQHTGVHELEKSFTQLKNSQRLLFQDLCNTCSPKLSS